MSQVRLRFIPYNARLLDARKERGWTQKDMSQLTGISVSYFGHIETLRAIPPQHVMDEISAALNLAQDYLFPETLMEAMREGLFDQRTAELEEQQLISLTEARRARMLPPHITDEEMVDLAGRAILKKNVAKVLDTLHPREKRVIELRFGLKDGISWTAEEVGKEFNLTRERIRQIEWKALRKLRHPMLSRELVDFLE